ncbi:MAG: phage major capsid protein [Deltaproteobacteria bacterium]
MRNPIEVLREKLAQITADAKSVEASVAAAGRVEFTDDESTKLNELHAAFDATEAQIAIHERNAKIEAAASVPQPSKTQPGLYPAPALTAARVQPVSATHANHGFVRGISEFMQAVKMAAYGKSDQRLLNAITTYGGEGGPGGDSGGFAVPPQFAASITELVVGEGSLASRFNPIMTSSNQVVLPTDETTPYGTSGIYAEWLGEATAMTARAPSLKQVTINLNKVGAIVHLSDELVEDSPAIQSHVTRKVAAAIAAKVNAAILNGDGLAKPLGLLKAPGLVTQAKAATGATTINAADLPNMMARMVPESIGSSFWLAHNTVLPKIWTLVLGQMPIYAQDFRQSPFGAVLGRPLVVTEFCQDYNTAGDIMLVSPDGYALAIKAGGIQTAASIHFAFDQGLQSFRATMRVGGTPLASAVIARANGSNTLSHIVALAARS